MGEGGIYSKIRLENPGKSRLARLLLESADPEASEAAEQRVTEAALGEPERLVEQRHVEQKRARHGDAHAALCHAPAVRRQQLLGLPGRVEARVYVGLIDAFCDAQSWAEALDQ